MTSFMEAFNTELAEAGELVETRALAAPVHTRRLGAQNGVPFVTDGPYAETQEVLAGYWIVECDSFDRATEIAGRLAGCPAPEQVAANAYADVRPIMESAAEIELLIERPVSEADVESLLRQLAPQVLGAVVRRYGTSTLPRTPCRRPCWRRRPSGRARVCRTTRRAG